ncbi:MAG: MoxR-like ATPase [Candidatus Saccharibacteria bacterium]|nr:MoxR-like ATPase [Candidatus Saccharibacteria bacterium]
MSNPNTMINDLVAEVSSVAVGDRQDLFVAAAGVVLGEVVMYEGPYGTGKTWTSKALADATEGTFGRVQGTADLLPADITGTDVFDRRTDDYVAKYGAIFKNVVLIDEIGRIPAKTQSGTLEAFGERQVTFPHTGTHRLPEGSSAFLTYNPQTDIADSFAVSAESNDIEGALLNRVFASIRSGLTPSQKREATRLALDGGRKAQPVVSQAQLIQIRSAIDAITIDSDMLDVITDVPKQILEHGKVDPYATGRQIRAGARDTIALGRLARFFTAVRGQKLMDVDDIKRAAPYVYAHMTTMNEVGVAKKIGARQAIREAVGNVGPIDEVAAKAAEIDAKEAA